MFPPEHENDDGFEHARRERARRRSAYLDAVDRISGADPDSDCLRALATARVGCVWESWDADDQRWATLAMLIEILRPGAPTGSLADADRIADALDTLIAATLGATPAALRSSGRSEPEALCRVIEGAADVAVIAGGRLAPGELDALGPVV
jgi:hypothetical protein